MNWNTDFDNAAQAEAYAAFAAKSEGITPNFSVRIRAKLRKQAQALADADGQSLGQTINVALAGYIEQRQSEVEAQQ